MTEGYKRGWLTFKYPTQASRLREDFIIQQIEKDRLLEFHRVRLQAEASLASAIPNKASFELVYATLDQYKGLALPYLATKASIKQMPSPEDIKADLAYWADFIKQKEASGGFDDEEAISPTQVIS